MFYRLSIDGEIFPRRKFYVMPLERIFYIITSFIYFLPVTKEAKRDGETTTV